MSGYLLIIFFVALVVDLHCWWKAIEITKKPQGDIHGKWILAIPGSGVWCLLKAKGLI